MKIMMVTLARLWRSLAVKTTYAGKGIRMNDVVSAPIAAVRERVDAAPAAAHAHLSFLFRGPVRDLLPV